MPKRDTFELVRVEKRPGLLDRIRSYWTGPLTSRSPELAKLFGGGETLSGISVNEESALTSSPVWSAVTMISDDIASLPLHLYKKTGKAKERYEDHPLYTLLHDAPNPEMDSMVMRRTMQAHALIWQNAYAEIERDAVGRPIALWPLVPESVFPYRDRNFVLRYRVTNPSGSETTINAEDMIHLVGHSHDGSVGSSMVRRARESIGMALAAEKFGASFFGNGATFGGTISYPGPKPPELSDKNYKESLEARHTGVQRAYKLLALYNGAKYERGGVPPNEGQFNETRIFQIREVARWFKIPPHKLGDLADATYSNVEQMDAAYMSSCIRPWLILWQQQLSRKLISRLERKQQFIEHDTHGFLSVDATARAALYASEFNVGGLTPNEERGYENRNPVEGGEDTFIQINMIPLGLARPWWQAQIDEKQAQTKKLLEPPPAPPVPGPVGDPADKETIASQDRKIRELADSNELLKAAVDERAADVLRAQAERDTERAAHVGTREQVSTLSAEVLRLNDALRLEVSAHAETHAGWKASIDEYRAQVAAINGQCEIWESKATQRALDLEQRTTERDDALAALSQTNALLGDATAALAAAKAAGVADAIASTEALYELNGIRYSEVSERDARIAALVSERDEALADKVEALDLFAESTAALAAEQAERAREAAAATAAAEKAVRDLEDAKGARIMAETEADIATKRAEVAERERDAALTAEAITNSDAEQVRQREVTRLTAVITAHRALMVDTIARLVRRETEKARRNQATPQKLRAWADTFYAEFVDVMADALTPIMRAHLAWLQSDDSPESAARAIALAHVTESRKQLQDVTIVAEFQPALAKLLERWENRRPEVAADRIVAEGMTYVRSYQ